MALKYQHAQDEANKDATNKVAEYLLPKQSVS
jgi:hypothetical protein